MWLGGGEDGVVTWYNPSFSIIEEAEDISGVNISIKNVYLFTPAGHQRQNFALSLYSEKGAGAQKFKASSCFQEFSTFSVYQSTAYCAHNSCFWVQHTTCTVYKQTQTWMIEYEEEGNHCKKSSSLRSFKPKTKASGEDICLYIECKQF